MARSLTRLLAIAFLFTSCAKPAPPPLKNILLITIDTLRSDRLGCYGDLVTRTPALDALARRGTLFPDAFSPIPITLPSHASIMTALYPRSHLVLSHAYTLAPERATLAEILKEKGYATAAFISSHVLSKEYGLDQGFDVYWERWRADPQLIEDLRESRHELTGKAVRLWLKQRPPGHFFAWAHFFQPHKPYAPPAPLDRMYDRDYSGSVVADVPTLLRIWEERIDLAPEDLRHIVALYSGEVTLADTEVGRIIDLLENEGILKDTIVIVTADHGEVLYEHDHYFGHDIMLYDPAIRVPLVVYGDGIFPEGAVVPASARLIDIAPTILDVLGLPVGLLGETDGRSLMSAVEGTRSGATPPGGRGARSRSRDAAAAGDTLFAEVFPPKPNWKVEPRHALRLDGWKLIHEDGRDSLELYDLASDPAEEVNRAPSDPETLARLRSTWDAWRVSKEAAFQMSYPDIDPETEATLRALGYIGN